MRDLFYLNFHTLLVLLLATLMISQNALAQEECETPDMTAEDREYMISIRNDIENYRSLNTRSGLAQVPVYFHLKRPASGTPPNHFDDLSQTEIDDLLDYLNIFFAPASLSFFQLGNINYMDFDDANFINIMTQASYVSSAINIYFIPGQSLWIGVKPIKDPQDYNTYYDNTITVAPVQNWNPLFPSFAHEFGHSFGLEHTFITAPYISPPGLTQDDHPEDGIIPRELAIRSSDVAKTFPNPNCSFAADMCCDTHAACRSSNQNPDPDCPVTWASTPGSYKDYNNDDISPDTENFMSYYSRSNRDHFSDCQYDFMAYYYDNRREAQYDNTNYVLFNGKIELEGSNQAIRSATAELRFPDNIHKHTNTISDAQGNIQGFIYDKDKIKAKVEKSEKMRWESFIENGKVVTKFYFTTDRNDWIDGIDAWDLYRIKKHIQGTNYLSDGYRKIAADVNKDGLINQTDINLLGALLAGDIEKFPAFNNPWRFIPEFIPQELSTAFNSNPFDMMIQSRQVLNAVYTDSDYLFSLSNSQISNYPGFDGVKIGDVNRVALANEAIAHYEEHFTYPTAPVIEEGNYYKITFKIDSINKIAAWQMGLHFDSDKMEVLHIANSSILGYASSAYYGTQDLPDNMLRLLWFNNAATEYTITTEMELFTVFIKANDSISDLGSLIYLNNEALGTLFLDDTAGVLKPRVKLEVEEIPLFAAATIESVAPATSSVSKTVMAAFPNPFSDFIDIEFMSQTEDEVTIEILDMKGSILRSATMNVTAGSNRINIDGLEKLKPATYILRVSSPHISEQVHLVK